jgi:dimethylargininase
MLTALTRGVSPSLVSCELEYLERRPIDLAKAIDQHRNYEACLMEMGARVISLPADADLPDCVFIEDPAILLDEVAVICRMGAASRRKESAGVAEALRPFRELKWLQEPATLEGGDVMRAGNTLYAGVSRRSNREGSAELARLSGFPVIPVAVTSCLHLKSACCYLGDGRVLANRQWIEPSALDRFRVLDVPLEEPAAANVLRIGETVLIPASFPRTAELLERSGFRVRAIDISELQKAEAGVTCSSLIFER